MKKFTLLLLTLFSFFSTISYSQTPTQIFDNFFNNHLSSFQGNVAVIVGCEDQVLYSYERGSYTTGSKVPVQSLSKWVTSTVIMRLVQENKLALDDKVGQYISSWNGNGKQNITIRQLLSHTNGLPPETEYDTRTDLTLEQSVNLIATNIALVSTPGTTFAYGSASYQVASRVAEVVEGKLWKQIFAEKLANVAGMPNASFISEFNPMTGRGLHISASEYANFLKTILNHGRYNSTNVLDSTSVLVMEQKNNAAGNWWDDYGLGLFRDTYPNGNLKAGWHPGVNGCFAWVDREKKVYGVILSAAGQDNVYGISSDFKSLVNSTYSGNECSNVNPCNFNINASGPSGNVTMNSSVTLNASCSGECSGVSYSWSGNGISGSGSSVTFNAPNTPGSYTYTVTASKSGCSNKTANVTINVENNTNPCDGYSFTDGQLLGTSLGNNVYVRVINSCWYVTTNNPSNSPVALDWLYILITNNTWATGVTPFSSSVVSNCFKQPSETCSGPNPCDFNVSASGPTGNVNTNASVTLNSTCSGSACSGVTYAWSGNGISGSGTSVTFNAPNSAGSYTYTVTTSKSGCSNKTATVTINVVTPNDPCAYTVSASGPTGNVNTNASVTLNSTCSGSACSGVTYAWSGNGISGSGTSVSFNAPNTTGSYTYTVTASKSGCSNKTATYTLNVDNGGSNPCNLTEKGVVGTWNGLQVQTRQYTISGQLKWVVVIYDPTPGTDRHFPRGDNFVERGDISWANGPILKSCLGAGDTGWGGLGFPSGITIPSGYIQGAMPDGAVYFEQSSSPSCNFNVSPTSSNGTPNINSSITLNANCSGGDCGAVNYAWSGNGISGNNNTVTFNVPGSANTYTYTVTASKSGCSNKTATVNVNVVNPTNPCAFTLSASGPTGNVTTNSSVTLNSSCSGECSGVSYAWSGNGISGSGTSVSFNAPNSAGSYTYTITGSKSGCSNQTATATINVVTGGGGSVNCNTSGGHFDGANCNSLSGWAWDGSQPNTPVVVEIYNGNTLVQGNILANNFRQDLLDAYIGNGVHGFNIPLPAALKDGGSHWISVRIAGCSTNLNNSPKNISGCTGSSAVIAPYGEDAASAAKALNVFPNPSNGTFETSFYLERGQKANIVLTDLQGRTLLNKAIVGNGTHVERINVGNKAAGTLFLRLVTNNGTEVKKISVIR